MIRKCDLIKYAVANFTKFGSKRFTMDNLAATLGISKKTIYKYFDSKEELVVESVTFLIEDYRKELEAIISSPENDAITNIILIYEKAFEHLKHFRPSFIFGLKKYYPKANVIFDDFRDFVVYKIVYGLLEDAKKQGIVKPEINIQLFCDLYFNRFAEIAFKKDHLLIEKYTNKELLNHFVIYNLRGITVLGYNNSFFE
ncbi:TetR/AcrR family transcriptional regulator [Flavivirga sp. 57AJ16]|uniref:TetR/AcrR family transcriptional regulator n=1 Tax=Flavivirga sp. 57AJ16 TaxID=3025307 RepID=UPI0023659E62|nr:TetR/AcrR family transcriptional regulator [Flavivirga sp. 57AJ16]MDD7888145.1 TetR/AcrR family transcriptional regulator [Flavivirga sp. 57AJ16]